MLQRLSLYQTVKNLIPQSYFIEVKVLMELCSIIVRLVRTCNKVVLVTTLISTEHANNLFAHVPVFFSLESLCSVLPYYQLNTFLLFHFIITVAILVVVLCIIIPI